MSLPRTNPFPATCETCVGLHAEGKEKLLTNTISEMDIKSGEILMDYGCCTGAFALEHLAPLAEKLNLTIYGVDNSKSMIEYAKKKYSHERINYIHGDVVGSKDFPLSSMKFNRIFSFYYIQFLSDNYKDEIKGLYNLLEQNGELLVVVWYHPMLFKMLMGVGNNEDLDNHEKKWIPDMDWVTNCIEHPDNFKEMHKLDLNIKNLSIHKKTYTQTSLRAYAELFLAAISFIHDLTEEEVNKIRTYYIDFIKDSPTNTHTPHEGSENEPYTIEYDTINILFKKE